MGARNTIVWLTVGLIAFVCVVVHVWKGVAWTGRTPLVLRALDIDDGERHFRRRDEPFWFWLVIGMEAATCAYCIARSQGWRWF